MKKWTLITISATVLAGAALIGSAIAAPSQDRAGKITPWEAMSIAEHKTNGKAFNATYEHEDGLWGYSVMVVSKGKLWEVEINAKTGKVGDVEGADPAGEGKELTGDLQRALKGGKESDEKGD
ncbi:MAG TPA: PepSY domain-containing protein [Fimbriimonadaceae bacterium]|jgi:hypothetical protein